MESKREQIAWAAATTIEEHGFEGASLREVAAQTGSSLGLVTYHFRDREDLLVATMDVVARAIRSRVNSSSADRLEALLRSVLPLDKKSRTQSAVWLAFATLAARDRMVRDRFVTLYEEWEAEVAAELGSRGVNGDVQVVAAVLTATVDGIAIRALASRMAATQQLVLLRAAIERCTEFGVNRGPGM